MKTIKGVGGSGAQNRSPSHWNNLDHSGASQQQTSIVSHDPGQKMMIKPVTTHRRAQSAAEEILNSVSHGVGLAAAVIALPFLLAAAEGRGGSAATIGAGAFAFTVILLYLSSALYHYLPESAGKRVFRLLDHGAIFVLIAGTYTPFTLGVLRGAWGWTLLSLVWAFAVKSEFASATQLGKLTVAGSAPRQL